MPDEINKLDDNELIKRINEEANPHLTSERTTYTRAIAVGEMLVMLRLRRNATGGWRDYLKEKCPKLAYETATLWIRLFKNQPKILVAAKAQSVTVTDLTVGVARKLIATPSKTKAAPAGGVEPGNQPPPDAPSEKEIINNWGADELFAKLKQGWEIEKLKALSTLLSEHVGKSFARRPVPPQAA
jgi:hypothetical protein